MSVLEVHGWQDVGLAGRVRGSGGLRALWTSRAGRAPKVLLDPSRPDTGGAALQARLAPLGVQAGGSAPVSVAVLLGCEAAAARRVPEAAPRGPGWLLGTPLPADALPTEDLSPGLLALGEVARPPLAAAIHDAVELVARALGSAARTLPEHALLPAAASCRDPQPGGPKATGRLLAQ